MSKWTIYSKSGSPRLDIQGNGIEVSSLEYNGTRMGERFLSVNVNSPYPINFAVGDYITYRGEKFEINYEPSLLKKSGRGKHGEGFVYSGIKFNSLADELVRCDFTDIVLYETDPETEHSTRHYTMLPTVDFYAETVDDLLDRIQANLNTIYTGNEEWIILSPNKNGSILRGSTDERKAEIAALWEVYFDGDGEREYEVVQQMISLNNQKCWDALLLAYNVFKLSFIIHGRTIVVGSVGNSDMQAVSYGKGHGLYEIERNADSNQEIVTRMKAYGTTQNVPYKYYAMRYGVPFLSLVKVSKIVNTHSVFIEITNADNMLPDAITSAWQKQNPRSITEWSIMWEIPDEAPYAMVKVAGSYADAQAKEHIYEAYILDNRQFKVSSIHVTWFLALQQDDWAAIQQTWETSEPSDQNKIFYVEGINRSKCKYSSILFPNAESMPEGMDILNLMLPGFPGVSLYDWVVTPSEQGGGGGTVVDAATGKATWRGYTAYFSKDRLLPYIDSLNVDDIGIRPQSVFFDGSNETEEVYPTLSEVTIEDLEDAGYNPSEMGWVDETQRVDEIQMRDEYLIVDDGFVYEENTSKNATTGQMVQMEKHFYVDLPYLGFDLKKAIEDAGADCKISVIDGMLGGREFPITDVEDEMYMPEGDTKYYWKVKCERQQDSSLGLYFPYASYNFATGNHYVLLGINLPDSYVDTAAARLLKEALKTLDENDETRNVIVPKIDELYMARQHDAVVAQRGQASTPKSLYESIEEGGFFNINDEDFGQLSIPIQTLTIKEYGNGRIPTYQITLQDEPSVSSIQKTIQNAVSVVVNANGGGGGGASTDDIRNYGDKHYLSKMEDDVAEGVITFVKQVILQSGAKIGDGFYIDDDGEAKLKSLIIESLQSPNFVSGLAGWNIDQNGNMEAETLHLRSALEVDELRINRQQAQEGDTIFAENDQIESVEEQYDEAQGVMTYVLTLKEKWEGYFTAQQYGNILRGTINTLAAKEAGVSDYTGQEYQASQQQDAGGNKYYTSFMQVIATHNTDAQLGVNQIRVILFGDNEVPMSKNYPPCALMAIARRGCIDYSAQYEGQPNYNDVVESIRRRQQCFMIMSSDGRIVKLTGVDSPILRNGNYGTTLGTLPEFVQNYPTVRERMIAGRDYLYAQGVVVGDFIKVDVEGNPIPTVVDKGEWQNNTPYSYNQFNSTTQQYETHRVRHNSGTWQCLVSQPVTSGGVATYYEPKWNSPYWMLVDGNDNLSIEFASSRGYSFRRGYVDTVITPHLFYGNVEIDADGTEIAAQYWNWTRSSESGKTTADETWDAQHTHMKQLHLTNQDMPSTWSTSDKAIFTLSVTVNDGKSDRIVQNQIIS